MRKISLTRQIILLFSTIFCVSSVIFSLLMLSRAEALAEAETYKRLGSYVEIMLRQPEDSEDTSFDTEEFEVAFIRGYAMPNGTGGTIINSIYSTNLINFIPTIDETDDTSMSVYYYDLLRTIAQGKEVYGYIENDKGENIYYYTLTDMHGEFLIAVTNSAYIGYMKSKVVLQSFVIFITVFVFGGVLILIWSRGIVRRIHKMQEHIDRLDKENYLISYDDDGNDEISELSDSIEVMRNQIQKNEKTKQDMLQNVSHDFKTPIAVIKSYAEALEDGIDSENACQIIIQQTDILKNKVNKLLQYNKLEYLKKEREFDKINMKELIENVVKTYKFQTETKIIMELDEIYFDGYYENFYTVIDNIIDNAKRYAKTTIKITLKDDKLIIYNDGDFIDEQFLNGLFKPYEKGSKGQFGLGMSIVVKTLNFFGMQLSVSNEDIGVSFTISK